MRVTGGAASFAAPKFGRLRPPRRRARLPGPARLRELRREPWARTRWPLDRDLGRLGDERLIGLMMVRNEADILALALESNTRWFDRILVLDGSNSSAERRRTNQILDRFPEVVFRLHDDEVGLELPARDGWRQVLLDEARRRYGTDNWIGILHGDELFDQDPRPMVAAHNPVLDPVIRVRLVHAFLHSDDASTWDPCTGSVRERVRHYMWPGIPESRFFFDRGDRDYEIDRHSKVVPRSFRTGPLHDGFFVVGYNERSPEQLLKRSVDRRMTNWQTEHYDNVDATGAFVPSLHERTGTHGFGHMHLDRRYGSPEVRSETQLRLAARAAPRRPIFVGGTGRCGSTLVKELLGDHPLATAHPLESKFISWPAGLLHVAEHPTRRRLAMLRERLHDTRPSTAPDAEHRLTHNWGFRAQGASTAFDGYDEAVDLLIHVLRSRRTTREQRQTAVREFVHWVFDRRCTSGQTHWIDHTPAHIDRVASLLETFPNAVFVHVIRDPRDVAASLTRVWWGDDSPAVNAANVNRTLSTWQRFSADATSELLDRTTEVRFENLLADPSEALRPVFEMAGLPPQQVRQQSVRTDAFGFTSLPEHQQRSVAAVVGALAEDLGYA